MDRLRYMGVEAMYACGLAGKHWRSLSRGEDVWAVRERDASRVPGAYAPTCLIFESDQVVRRLWNFPSNWTDMDDDTLWRLAEVAPTAGSEMAVLIQALQTAFITAIVADRRASSLIAAARRAVAETRALREQRRTQLEACRASRQDMHNCVTRYARGAKENGRSAADVLHALEGPVGQTAFVVDDGQRLARLAGDVARWCAAEFHAA
jgi:hypothetical protein